MSLKGRLRRLDAGVRWLETEGVFIRWQLRMKLAQMTQAIADHRARVKALPPRVRAPILRDAPLRSAPQDEVVRVQAKPHPEERPARPRPGAFERLRSKRPEGCESALPGQPVAPPSPDMEIRPTHWRPHGAQDYGEEERPGTNGRCITEYDPLRNEDDDDDSLVE